jgi:hypothetical protein
MEQCDHGAPQCCRGFPRAWALPGGGQKTDTVVQGNTEDGHRVQTHATRAGSSNAGGSQTQVRGGSASPLVPVASHGFPGLASGFPLATLGFVSALASAAACRLRTRAQASRLASAAAPTADATVAPAITAAETPLPDSLATGAGWPGGGGDAPAAVMSVTPLSCAADRYIPLQRSRQLAESLAQVVAGPRALAPASRGDILGLHLIVTHLVQRR